MCQLDSDCSVPVWTVLHQFELSTLFWQLQPQLSVFYHHSLSAGVLTFTISHLTGQQTVDIGSQHPSSSQHGLICSKNTSNVPLSMSRTTIFFICLLQLFLGEQSHFHNPLSCSSPTSNITSSVAVTF